jgi:hypothetical protein
MKRAAVRFIFEFACFTTILPAFAYFPNHIYSQLYTINKKSYYVTFTLKI